MTLIDKDALVADITHKIKVLEAFVKNFDGISDKVEKAKNKIEALGDALSFIENLEVKDVDLELITGWFDHIAQIADDRMTLTNQKMTDAYALDEIKCLAKNSSEFIKTHYKAQKGE